MNWRVEIFCRKMKLSYVYYEIEFAEITNKRSLVRSSEIRILRKLRSKSISQSLKIAHEPILFLHII